MADGRLGLVGLNGVEWRAQGGRVMGIGRQGSGGRCGEICGVLVTRGVGVAGTVHRPGSMGQSEGAWLNGWERRQEERSA
jgi:hypothetical protein